MNIFRRLFNRIRFRRELKADEGANVVAGMAKAHNLYKSLAKKAHPDRNPDKQELAQDIMSRLTKNKHNYNALTELQKEIDEKL